MLVGLVKIKPTPDRMSGNVWKVFVNTELSSTFATSIGYEEKIKKRLKCDAVPTIFVDQPEQCDRPSAARIQEKKLKNELKATLKKQTRPVRSETISDDFLEHGPFEATPYTSTVTMSTVSSSTTTCTTATSSTVMSTYCPLTWFASVTEQQQRLEDTSPVTHEKMDHICAELDSRETESLLKVNEKMDHSCVETESCETERLCKVNDNKCEMYSMQTQTPQNLVSRRSVLIQNVAKMVDASTQTKPLLRIPVKTPDANPDHDISLNDSLISIESNNTDRDPEWTPDHEEMDCEDEMNESDVTFVESNEATEKKYIVYDSCLDELLKKCVECGSDGLVTKKTIGTCVIVTTSCVKCGFIRNWTSQPMTGTMPFGNLILSAAVMFCGASPVKCLRMLDFAGVENICISMYNNIQSAYLTPSVMSVWSRSQQQLIEEIHQEDRSVRLAGDALCCSPGHTAKFGSYSMLDLDTGKILDFKLVQSNEVRNSNAMELEGLQRSLEFLANQDVTISDIITDRHSSVKKYLREQQPEINHWFDVWHVAKGVYKKLESAGKKKGCEKVKQWARSVSNHLYWCAASSDGDGQLVKEKWTSILNHVTNVHEGHGDRFPRCAHGDLENRNWMERGFKPHAELEKVVKGRLLLTDIQKLSPTDQTSSLESFHKVICSYAAKAVHYFHPQMEARTALAAIHFNENAQRPQATTRAGQKQYAMSFPKSRKGEPIAKEVKVNQTFDYIDELMVEVIGRRNLNKSYREARRARQAEEPHRPPPIAQSTPRPNKADIVRVHISRFNR